MSDITVRGPTPLRPRERVPTVRVWPRDEDVRKNIRHPSGGIAFRGTMQDSVEWPMDQFTRRRINDGSVLTEAPEMKTVSGENQTPTEGGTQPQRRRAPGGGAESVTAKIGDPNYAKGEAKGGAGETAKAEDVSDGEGAAGKPQK